MARPKKAACTIVLRLIAYERAWRARTSLNGAAVVSTSHTCALEMPTGTRNAVELDLTAGMSTGGTCQTMLSLPDLKSVTMAVVSGSRMKSISLRHGVPPK